MFIEKKKGKREGNIGQLFPIRALTRDRTYHLSVYETTFQPAEPLARAHTYPFFTRQYKGQRHFAKWKIKVL